MALRPSRMTALHLALTTLIVLGGCTRASSPRVAAPTPALAPVASLANAAPAQPIVVQRLEVPGGVRRVATNGSRVAILTWDDDLIVTTNVGVETLRVRLDLSKLQGDPWPFQIVGDVLVIAASGAVLGIDISDGRPRWRRLADGSDMFSSSIHDGVVWTDGDGTSFTVDARTGKDVTRHIPKRSENPKVDYTHEANERIKIVATDLVTGRELWRSVEHARTVDVIGDATVFVRAQQKRSTLVVLDTKTGAERWSLALDERDLLQWAVAGPDIYWLIINPGAEYETGVTHRWLAVNAKTGAILVDGSAPLPAVRYCAVNVTFASADGVLAVGHAIRSKRSGKCELAVVDIHTPSSILKRP
jgi:outer membrane protein assembly factor BamB